MPGFRAISVLELPLLARVGQWRRAIGIRFSPVNGYLRGLTLGRAGLVLLICAMFSVRQHSLCVFQIGCGMLDGQTLAGFARFLARQFLFAIPMLLAVTVADNATADRRATVRIGALSVAVVLGAVIHGTAFLYTQPSNVLDAAADRHSLFIFAYSSRALLYGGLATAVLYLFTREREDARALHKAQLEKLLLDRQMIEARLQVLQAQIEPHFLFNTLANVRTLYDEESTRAKPLIHDLAAYLWTALPQMRDTSSSLRRELALVQAYLRVLKVRMGERLNVTIDVPAHLGEATLPPMMVMTLVENSIKHGLTSLPQGGTITIRAECCGERLRVAVIDNGVGFRKGYGTGIGLANTRARLTALYGSAGRLTLDANPDGGVIAGIELPCEFSSAGRAST